MHMHQRSVFQGYNQVSNDAKSTHALANHLIAWVSGTGIAFLLAIYVFGWTIEHHGADLLPRIAVCVGTWLSIDLTTRLSIRWKQRYSFAAILLELIVEKILSWDLMHWIDVGNSSQPSNSEHPSPLARGRAGARGDDRARQAYPAPFSRAGQKIQWW